MLSAADIAMMQTELGLLRTTPCTISRHTLTADGWGGTVASWVTIASTTCRVRPDSQRVAEGITEARPANNVRWLIALAAGTDVSQYDRIVALGVTYEVAGVLDPRSSELERVAQCVVVV